MTSLPYFYKWPVSTLCFACCLVSLSGIGCSKSSGSSSSEERVLGIVTGTPNQPLYAAANGFKELLEERVDLQGDSNKGGFKKVEVIVTKGAVASAKYAASNQPAEAFKVKKDDGDFWFETQYARITGEQPNAINPNIHFFPYLGLTDRTALSQLPDRGSLRLITSLWNSHGHLIVSREIANQIRKSFPKAKNLSKGENLSLKDLTQFSKGTGRGRPEKLRIYIGSNGSTTYLAGRALFAAVGLPNADFIPRMSDTSDTKSQKTETGSQRREPKSHNEAARALRGDDPSLTPIDAALLIAGLPSEAAKFAIGGGCEILNIELDQNERQSLNDDPENRAVIGSLGWYEVSNPADPKKKQPIRIPADTYDVEPVTTFTTRSLLVAHENLDTKVVKEVVQALFTPRQGRTGQEVLLRHHAAAEEINLGTSLLDWTSRETYKDKYHPGAEEFWEAEAHVGSNVVWLYSGPMASTSYRLGAEMAEILKDSDTGIDARVVNTQGSSDSIARMQSDPNKLSLALVHNDAATNAFSHSKADAKSLRLLSFLYPETVHLITVDRAVPTNPADSDLCHCPPIPGLPAIPSLRNLVPALAGNHQQFGISNDKFALDRDLSIIKYYGDLTDHDLVPKAGTIDALDTNRSDSYLRLKPLSPVKIQERLIEGSLPAALVTSGTPMPLVNQMLTPDHPRLARAKRNAEQVEKSDRHCNDCNRRKSVRNLTFRVLPLDAGESDRQGKPLTPKSIQGLVTRNHLLKPATIPPSTYMRSQPEEAQTVGVELVLICRDDKDMEYKTAQILGSLFDNEVRLRSIVADIKLRDPLGVNSKEPSIPLHTAAREFYEKKGLLAPLPEPETWLTREFITPILTSAGFLLLGIVAPTHLRNQIQRVLIGYLFRQERQKNDFEKRLRVVYFKNEVFPQAKVEEIEEIMEEVCRACARHELSHNQAENLDLLARDYLERLYDTLTWMERDPHDTPNHERSKASTGRDSTGDSTPP